MMTMHTHSRVDDADDPAVQSIVRIAGALYKGFSQEDGEVGVTVSCQAYHELVAYRARGEPDPPLRRPVGGRPFDPVGRSLPFAVLELSISTMSDGIDTDQLGL